MREMGILKAGWKHIFFAVLIGFDVYIQKLENYCFLSTFRNRREYRNLVNKNVKLKVIKFMDKEKAPAFRKLGGQESFKDGHTRCAFGIQGIFP